MRPDRYIWLAGGASSGLLRTGQIVQEALATVGLGWELTAAQGNDAARLGATVHIDPAQVPEPQGYRLTIGTDQVRIAAHDGAGAFYAAMTLRQIARQATGTGELLCMRIEDWPNFPHRGVMLDVSRFKVPRMETLYMLVDMLAEWKINQLQLYTEHTFAYRNHREVWDDWSPMTGEQVLELDAYCRKRFIELVPNQNSFGHMLRWLIHPRYRPLADEPNRPSPAALHPLDPGSIQLLAELYEELLPHFSSRQFHVGCGEVHVGRGRSREACEERGAGRVYLEFLLKIRDLVQRHGRTMQFWGDEIIHYPELIPELPGDIIAMEWGYDADHPFAEHGAKFAQAGVPFYVCPGTSSWNSIAGRTDLGLGNMWNAAENGLAYGAIGYLNTDWGDNGHWQPLPVSFLGYAYGAAVSWASKANRDIDLPRALDLHAFHDSADVMGRLAYDLGNAYKEPGVFVPGGSMLAHIMIRHPSIEERQPELMVEGLERSGAYLDQVMARLPEVRMARPDAEQIADEFRNAAALLHHACHLGISRLRAVGRRVSQVPLETRIELYRLGQLPPDIGEEIARIPVDARKALASEMEETIAEYRRLWLARNREGGLGESVFRLERLLAGYKAG